MIFTPYSSKTLAASVQDWEQDELLTKLVVPVDFSECSYSAIRHAIAIAIRTGAELMLLHSVQLPVQTGEILNVPIADFERDAATKLSQIVAEINSWIKTERLRTIQVHFTVKTGFVSDEILWVAKNLNADMIVMGTRGAGAVAGMLLGSNASTVLQKSECAVMVVPEEAEFAGCRKIAFATDMVEIDAASIERLVGFAGHFDADLHLVHILTAKDRLNPSQASAFKEQFAQLANYPQLTFHVVDADGRTVVEALEDFADENDIQLLATRTHHRGFFEKLFHPSLSKQLAVHAKIPMIAFH